MKHCPECNRNYADPTVSFCLQDGAPLIFDHPSTDEPATAILTTGGSVANEQATRTFGQDPITGETSLDRAIHIASNRNSIIAGVVGFILVAALGVGSYFYYGRGSSKQIDSIAVMPFVNQSGNPDIEYLSDGMTDTLISSMAQLPDLGVKPRSSVFRYKGRDADARTIGKELNVAAILNGTVVQRGDEMALHVELIDTGNETLLWSRDYKGPLTNLVALQSEITRDVVDKLKIKLSGSDEQKLAKKYTENDEAYQLYLKGRFAWNKRSIPLATEFFQQAIARDPNYALAWAGLSDAYATTRPFTDADPVSRNERLLKGREAALKALSIDNNLAEAHTALGNVMVWINYDFAGAEREYRLAIENDPRYADAHYWLAGLLYSFFGRNDEAALEFKRALDLEPLNLVYRANYGGYLSFTGRHDEAIAYLEDIVELERDFGPTLGNLSNAYLRKGDYAKAIETRVRQLERVVGDHDTAARTRDAFSKGGWEGYLRFTTGKDRPKFVTFYEMAQCHAALGEKDQAFEALNKSYEVREAPFARVKRDPMLEPLRGDPRFNELLGKVGFP